MFLAVSDIVRYSAVKPPPTVIVSGRNAPGLPGQARKLEREREARRRGLARHGFTLVVVRP